MRADKQAKQENRTASSVEMRCHVGGVCAEDSVCAKNSFLRFHLQMRENFQKIVDKFEFFMTSVFFCWQRCD